MLNPFEDYQDRQPYHTEREQRLTPGKDVLRVYRQLKPWKLFVTLNHKEAKAIRQAPENYYPHIEAQSKDYVRAVRWGVVKGALLIAALILGVLVGGMLL